MWPCCQLRKMPTFVRFCAMSQFAGCLHCSPGVSWAASWNFRAFGFFGLEPNIFEVTLLVYKHYAHSPFAHPSRNWAAGRGSCAHSSMEQRGLWQSLAKPCLLYWDGAWCFFSPLFSFSDCFTSSTEHTALCRVLPWQTTLPTGAVQNLAGDFARQQSPVTLHRGCHPPDQSLWINITSR